MHIVYLISFTDKIKENRPPFYYIGSKSNASFYDGILYDSRGKEYWGSGSRDFLMAIKTERKKIEVLASFSVYNDALLRERDFHIHHDVVANIFFYNLSIATISSFHNPGYGTYRNIFTEKYVRLPVDHPKVISKEFINTNTGKTIYNNGTIQRHFLNDPGDGWDKGLLPEIKLKRTGENNSFYGKTHSDEVSKKIVDSRKKTYASYPDLYTEIIKNSSERMKMTMTGVPKTPEHKAKIGVKGMIMLRNLNTGEVVRVFKSEKNKYDSKIWVNMYSYSRTLQHESVSCPFCEKISDAGNSTFKQHHFDNCKHNPNRIVSDIITCHCGKSGESNNRGFLGHHFDHCKEYIWEPWNSPKNATKSNILLQYSKFDILFVFNKTLKCDISMKKRCIECKRAISYTGEPHQLRNMIQHLLDGFNPYENSSWVYFKERYNESIKS